MTDWQMGQHGIFSDAEPVLVCGDDERAEHESKAVDIYCVSFSHLLPWTGSSGQKIADTRGGN